MASPDKMSFATDTTPAPTALTGNAAELFVRHFHFANTPSPIRLGDMKSKTLFIS
jgi:hypothetical protein